MATINLTTRIQNPDASTTIYGAQGNAIEHMDGDGVSVFAAPLAAGGAATIPLWYAPAYSDQYFQSILDNPQLFGTVANNVKAFKLYAYQAPWTPDKLQALLQYAARSGITLGLEAPPLVAGPGEPGYGIESFATPGALMAFVTMVKQAGGTLGFVSWDEPWYFGSASTGLYTVDQVAAQVAKAASDIRAVFPNIQIGDIEPVGGAISSTAGLDAWFTAYAKAAGTPFKSFQADLQDSSENWQSALSDTVGVAHRQGIPVGAIVNGLNAARSDTAWATQAVANAQLILSDPTLRPDFLVVQSWERYPSEVADPGVAGTLASVAADIAGAAKAALAIPAVARYDLAGSLQSVDWSGGWQVVRGSASLDLLSPSGGIVNRIPWAYVSAFAFDPNSATVQLSLNATASGGAASSAGSSYSIGVGASGFAFAPAAVPGGALTLALSPSSQTGAPGSGITDQSRPGLTGTATANAVIALQVDGTSIGSVQASATGGWSYGFGAPLGDGAHVVQAALTGAAAGTHLVYVLSVDTGTSSHPALTFAPASDPAVPEVTATALSTPEQGAALSGSSVWGDMLGRQVGGLRAFASSWSEAADHGNPVTMAAHGLLSSLQAVGQTMAANFADRDWGLDLHHSDSVR